jgi:hypothetical protein
MPHTSVIIENPQFNILPDWTEATSSEIADWDFFPKLNNKSKKRASPSLLSVQEPA